MPRRIGNETNPYLIPVYNTTRHPCYKPPANHVAARALMDIVGSADLKPEDFLKLKQAREEQERHEKCEEILRIQQRQQQNEDSPYTVDEDEEEDNDNDDHDVLPTTSPIPSHHHQHQNQKQEQSISRRISEAKHFADLHRRTCDECRFEHRSKIEGEQKRVRQKECDAREKIINDEYEIRRHDLKIRYMERHVQIMRHLEATKKQRERAMRQAQREENQRMFDEKESTARNELKKNIFADLNKLIVENGIMNILNFIMLSERIDRKDHYKVFRATRHMVNIAGHLRAEKIRRIESTMFSLVKSEPNARRLLEAEWERGIQKLNNYSKEGKEMVATIEVNKRHAAQTRERENCEKAEQEVRTKQIGLAEMSDREALFKLRNQDRYRIYTEQLKQKRQDVEHGEAMMRQQQDAIFTRSRMQLFMKMLPSVEAGKRYEMRVFAWEEMKSIASEFEMDFTT